MGASSSTELDAHEEEDKGPLSVSTPSAHAISAIQAVEEAMGLEYDNSSIKAPSDADHAYWNYWFECCVAEAELLSKAGLTAPVEYPPAWPPHSLLMPGDDKSFTSVVSILASALLRVSASAAGGSNDEKGAELKPTGGIEVAFQGACAALGESALKEGPRFLRSLPKQCMGDAGPHSGGATGSFEALDPTVELARRLAGVLVGVCHFEVMTLRQTPTNPNPKYGSEERLREIPGAVSAAGAILSAEGQATWVHRWRLREEAYVKDLTNLCDRFGRAMVTQRSGLDGGEDTTLLIASAEQIRFVLPVEPYPNFGRHMMKSLPRP